MSTDAAPTAVPDTGSAGSASAIPQVPAAAFDLLHNVEMAVTVELGRTRMLLRDLLALRPGSVLELDRGLNSPVDVLVNGTLLARGEVVVVDDELGVRITEIGHPEEG